MRERRNATETRCAHAAQRPLISILVEQLSAIYCTWVRLKNLKQPMIPGVDFVGRTADTSSSRAARTLVAIRLRKHSNRVTANSCVRGRHRTGAARKAP
jgi:hypothetical protein